MKRSGGIALLMLLLLALLFHKSRDSLLPDGVPAFFPDESPGISVLLGEGFPVRGVHQFSDETTPGAVIGLTMPGAGASFCKESAPELPLRSGELLELIDKEGVYGCFRRGWMPAGIRLALGIPLHPDRMNRDDWEILPGIGPRLAERIEADRQFNGDFVVFTNLERVRGIGPQRILRWEEFFVVE